MPNRTPIAILAGAAEAVVGETLPLSAASSTDVDNDTLSFTWNVSSAPAGSSAQVQVLNDFGAATFTADVSGDYTITVLVSDGTDTATADFQVTASPEVSAPVLDELAETYSVEVGQRLAFDVTANGGQSPITFFAQPIPLPDGMSLDASTGAFLFEPKSGQEGSYVITIGASNGVETDSQSIPLLWVPQAVLKQQ